MRDNYPAGVQIGGFAHSAATPTPPQTRLPHAIDGVEKANAMLAEKIDQLGQRLAFVTQPESPGITGATTGRLQGMPRSEAIHRLESVEDRLMNLAGRIDGFLDRLEV